MIASHSPCTLLRAASTICSMAISFHHFGHGDTRTPRVYSVDRSSCSSQAPENETVAQIDTITLQSMTAFIQEHGRLERQPHIYESCPTHHHHHSLGPAGTSACLSMSAPIESRDTLPTPNSLASLLASRRNPSPSLSETSLPISQHPSSLHTSQQTPDQPIRSLIFSTTSNHSPQSGATTEPTNAFCGLQVACIHSSIHFESPLSPPTHATSPLTADHGSSGDACTAAAARLAQREVSQYGTHLPLLSWV